MGPQRQKSEGLGSNDRLTSLLVVGLVVPMRTWPLSAFPTSSDIALLNDCGLDSCVIEVGGADTADYHYVI
jgi:hypothetical protein